MLTRGTTKSMQPQVIQSPATRPGIMIEEVKEEKSLLDSIIEEEKKEPQMLFESSPSRRQSRALSNGDLSK